MSLDETFFLFNEGELKVLGITDKPRHDLFFSDSWFSIAVLRVKSAASVNGTVIFLAKGTNVQPSPRVTNFGTRYVLT